MTREKFFKELRDIHDSVIVMGNQAIEAIDKSIIALMRQDKLAAKEVIDGDQDIDEQEEMITSKGLHILLSQQPMANDFKEISAVMKLVVDMERIADQASDIARLSMNFNGPFIKKIEHIPAMSEVAKQMVRDSLKAFIDNDQDLAIRIIEEDDRLDDLYQTVRKELIGAIPDANEGNAEQVVDLLIIAKYLERIGDHATNICEWIIFNNTGFHKSNKLL